ncbi:MAG: type II secretion system protein [Bacilli bacterium]|nr:type II secretion system protein [Bacilli bacterium]
MKKEGFTLIELLTVIVILGIIITVAFPSLKKVFNDNSEKAYKYQIQVVDTALDLYVKKNTSSFSDGNSCYFLDYKTLLLEDYFTEENTTCSGIIKLNRIRTSGNFEYEYFLDCNYKGDEIRSDFDDYEDNGLCNYL